MQRLLLKLRSAGYAALGVTVAAACTPLADGSVPLGDDALGLGDGGLVPTSGGEAFQCEESAPPQAGNEEPERVTLSIIIVDTTTDSPPPDLQVNACQLIDVSCESPVTPEPVAPGQDGSVTLDLPYAFNGFLEMTSEQTVPAMYFVPQALEQDTVVPPLGLISPRALEALATGNGVTLDTEGRGLVLLRTYDCEGNAAAGIELESDRAGEVFMFVEGLPIVGAAQTRADGLGGFINVPPGLVRVEGTHAASASPVGSASLVVRGQWMTYGDLRPDAL